MEFLERERRTPDAAPGAGPSESAAPASPARSLALVPAARRYARAGQAVTGYNLQVGAAPGAVDPGDLNVFVAAGEVAEVWRRALEMMGGGAALPPSAAPHAAPLPASTARWLRRELQ